MSLEQLRRRIAKGEDQNTIFVPTANNIQVIGRAVCALLNTDGGTVFCGVDDFGTTQVLAEDPFVVASRVEAGLREAISPLSLFTADVVDFGSSKIVLVEVPAGKDRPYVFEGGVWLRFGAELRAADRDTLRELLKTSTDLAERWERRSSPAMSIEDLDEAEVQSTVREIVEGGRFQFTSSSDPFAVLRDLSLTTQSGFTQGGDILFSQLPARRHPQCRAQLIGLTDKAQAEFVDNRWFEGPIVRTCRDMFSAVAATVRVKSEFGSRDGRRSDLPAYDLDALREGIVNAFVHRDYSSYSGGLRVTVYGDRIEIWNSGSLPEGLTPGRLRSDHPSILINPDIAQVFYLRNLMERIGRGTELIAKASHRLGAPPPRWRQVAGGITLSIFSAHLPEVVIEGLNERQSRLIGSADPSKTFAFKDYAERYAGHVSDRQARRDLEGLVKRGWVVRSGKGEATIYAFSPDMPGH